MKHLDKREVTRWGMDFCLRHDLGSVITRRRWGIDLTDDDLARLDEDEALLRRKMLKRERVSSDVHVG